MREWKLFSEEFEANLFFVFEIEKNEISIDDKNVFSPLFPEGIPDFSFEMTLLRTPQIELGLLDLATKNNFNLILTDNSNINEVSFCDELNLLNEQVTEFAVTIG